MGFSLIRVYLDFYEFDSEKEDRLVKYLVDNKITGFVARTIGDWDLAISFYAKNQVEFLDNWFNVLKSFRSIIKTYHTNIIVKEYFFRRAYLNQEKKDISNLSWERGGEEKVKIDEIDREIIKTLTQNSRTPITEIAESVKLGSMGIIYRIKNLAKNKILLGSRANLNFSKLGYEYYKVIIELEDISVFKKIFSYCQMHPNIISVTKSISDNVDLEFDLEIENFETFIVLIEKLKQLFPKSIRDFKFFRFLEFKKTAYLPL